MKADLRLQPEGLRLAFALASVVIACCFGCRSTATESVSLGLSVERRGTDYHIKWNPNSPVVRSAARGLLTIEDGGLKREFELDSRQLRSPSIVYSPFTGKVTVRLTIHAAPTTEVISLKNELPVAPVSAPKQEPSPPPDKREPGAGFAVQLGIFSTRAEAERYETIVRRDHLVSELLQSGEGRWRLRAGCVSAAEDAEQLANRLRQRFPGAVVVRGCTPASK